MITLRTISAQGLEQLAEAMAQDEIAARKAASITVNAAARLAKREGSKQIRRQVDLKPQYVNRNMFIRFAREGELSATVTGRFRPTSLARFATNRTARHGAPARLRVKKGSPASVNRRMFLFRKLRAGTQEGLNTGVAIRLKPGERLQNRKKAVQFSKSDSRLFLMYAPSVDQVFKTVRGDLNPMILRFMDTEFDRQFTRLSR